MSGKSDLAKRALEILAEYGADGRRTPARSPVPSAEQTVHAPREEIDLSPAAPPRQHARAIKIYSEVLGAFLWIVLDPQDTDPDPGRYDAPVYSRAEVERLVEAHKRGEVSPDQLRALHMVKRTWPGVQAVDGAGPAHDVARSEAIGKRDDVDHGPKRGGTRR